MSIAPAVSSIMIPTSLLHTSTVLVTGAVFAIIGGVYYWIPKWTGNMYSRKTRENPFLVVNNFCQCSVLFPQIFLRFSWNAKTYSWLFNSILSLTCGQVLVIRFGFVQVFCIIVWRTVKGKGTTKATDRVWDSAKGLEWFVPSPAPSSHFQMEQFVKDEQLAHVSITLIQICPITISSKEEKHPQTALGLLVFAYSNVFGFLYAEL